MWVWPQVPLGGPPPPPPCALGPLPSPHQPGPPPPKPCKKRQGGWGEVRRRGRGGKGFGLREGSSNCNRGWGHKLRNHPQPQGRGRNTEVECRTPTRSTSPNSCSTGPALWEGCTKSPVLQEKGPGVQGKKWPKYRYWFSRLRVRGGSRPSNGGGPPNTSWGQTHIWGLPNVVFLVYWGCSWPMSFREQGAQIRPLLRGASISREFAKRDPPSLNPWGGSDFIYVGAALKGTNPRCGFLRVPVVFCGFLRKSADFCGFLRKSADFCKNLRFSAKIYVSQEMHRNLLITALKISRVTWGGAKQHPMICEPQTRAVSSLMCSGRSRSTIYR